MDSCAKGHAIEHFLVALNQLGEDFGHNRDTYYSLGRYFGYTDVSLLNLESQTNPLSRYCVTLRLQILMTTFLNFYLL